MTDARKYDEQQADLLDDYWANLARNPEASPPAELEPMLAAFTRWTEDEFPAREPSLERTEQARSRFVARAKKNIQARAVSEPKATLAGTKAQVRAARHFLFHMQGEFADSEAFTCDFGAFLWSMQGATFYLAQECPSARQQDSAGRDYHHLGLAPGTQSGWYLSMLDLLREYMVVHKRGHIDAQEQLHEGLVLTISTTRAMFDRTGEVMQLTGSGRQPSQLVGVTNACMQLLSMFEDVVGDCEQRLERIGQ
jgi:hypothetical protein